MAVDPIDLATIVTATRNFSKRNVIGEGAFGIVYEGNLPSDHPFVESLPGRKVAVKRVKLSSLPGRLLSDFTREVELVSELRHDNLVRLLAYCSDGNERILVYESNLSNLPGYAAPEYAKDGDMTLKCDVFSFGVVLLEIISGRKNSVVPSLILQVWKLWDEHRVMDLLDAAVAPARHRSAPELLSELRRCIQIGLLCVQQSPGDRPAMSAVLSMLTRTQSSSSPRVGIPRKRRTAPCY
ncbi:hypothetical protein VPH35_040169 [Triticum aestivum]